MKQSFILARTEKSKVIERFDETGKEDVYGLEWFLLEKMRASEEVIYPVGLKNISSLFYEEISQKPAKNRDPNCRPVRALE